jgi:hypothetical protein
MGMGIRRDILRHLRNLKREYQKDKINELAAHNKNKELTEWNVLI